jgi:hypothetical protein
MYALRENAGRVLAVVALTALVGCGADGEPVQPTLNAGVGVSTDGNVNVRGGLGLHQGPVSLYFGF